MTLAELIAEVYTITNRPDLVAETAAMVRAATLEAHHSDYYYKDLYETGIQFTDPTLYVQQFDYMTLDPRWRALKYLRKFDTSTSSASSVGTSGEFFSVLSPVETLDSYGIHRENICYVAGAVVQIRSNTALAKALLGYYRSPIITPAENYSSWVAITHPYVIIFRAVASVFKMVGNDNQQRAYNELWSIQLQELKMSNIIAVGY